MQETRPTVRVRSAEHREHEAFTTPRLCSHHILRATPDGGSEGTHHVKHCTRPVFLACQEVLQTHRRCCRCKCEETIGLDVCSFFGDEAALCIRPNLARLKYVGEVNFWSWSDMYPLMTCCEVDVISLILLRAFFLQPNVISRSVQVLIIQLCLQAFMQSSLNTVFFFDVLLHVHCHGTGFFGLLVTQKLWRFSSKKKSDSRP